MAKDQKKDRIIDYKVVPTPVVPEYLIIEIGEKYGVAINPEDVTQYKLCQVIHMLEKQLENPA